MLLSTKINVGKVESAGKTHEKICKGDTTKHRDITLTGFENL
jgi:hypothetical protein